MSTCNPCANGGSVTLYPQFQAISADASDITFTPPPGSQLEAQAALNTVEEALYLLAPILDANTPTPTPIATADDLKSVRVFNILDEDATATPIQALEALIDSAPAVATPTDLATLIGVNTSDQPVTATPFNALVAGFGSAAPAAGAAALDTAIGLDAAGEPLTFTPLQMFEALAAPTPPAAAALDVARIVGLEADDTPATLFHTDLTSILGSAGSTGTVTVPTNGITVASILVPADGRYSIQHALKTIISVAVNEAAANGKRAYAEMQIQINNLAVGIVATMQSNAPSIYSMTAGQALGVMRGAGVVGPFDLNASDLVELVLIADTAGTITPLAGALQARITGAAPRLTLIRQPETHLVASI